MPAPIDYGVQIADPTQAFLGAFQTGASVQEARFKQEQQQQQLANQKMVQEGFAKLRQPGATAADYANLSMLLPETQAKSVRESFNMLSGDRQQTALQQSGQVFSAFKAGKPEIAITLLDQQIAGKRNSGDEEGAKFLETWRDVAKENPKATEDYFGFTISQMPGGDKVIKSAIELGGERRAEAEAKPTLAKLEAEAISKGVEAEFARPLAQATLDKTNKEKLAPSVQEALDFTNLTSDQQKTFQALQILKKPPAAVTNVNVSNVDKTAAGELGKLVPDLYNQANSAASQLSDIPRYKLALDKAITGPFAEQRLTGARIANAFGFTGLVVNDPSDPNYLLSSNTLSPNFGFGTYLYGKKFYAGLSVPKLLKQSIDNQIGNSINQPHLYLMGGYVFPINSVIDLKPSTLIKYTENAPVTADLNVSAFFYKQVWLGVMYRMNESVGFNASCQLSNGLMVGYAFDFPVNGMRLSQFGNHELVISLNLFNKKNAFISPRYF